MRTARTTLPILALLLAACGPGIQVDSVAPAEAPPLRSGQSYTWRAGSGGVHGDLRMAGNQALDEHIRALVDEELSARGFRRVERGGDLSLAYVAAVERELEVEEVNEYLRYRRSLWLTSYTEVREYDQGSLVLDFTSRDGDLVWRGAAQAELHSENRDYREAKLREGVKALVDRLVAERGAAS